MRFTCRIQVAAEGHPLQYSYLNKLELKQRPVAGSEVVALGSWK